ncbi:LLM class flavin-dependent oxidoreductase [Dactylosporangium sp. NPDC051484]|uniref:LLM class flavin-dependent oxidoreductase n=1 Tax=Dactylosporangium sp. NPDC051484 TaxID=3154942 RepID=UPI00344CD994
MSIPVLLTISVGPRAVALRDAVTVAEAAEAAGVAAIRIADGTAAGRALDPTVVAAYLAGVHGGVGYVAELPTTHNAPYNAARRVLSLDRATGGRAGVALLAGDGDEVSEATAPDPGAAGPARRWAEYARVLTRLWESFPRTALVGDQDGGVVVDDTLIAPIDHEGVFYRVAGPLDGPSSVQGRPVVVADLDALDAAAVAESADVVVVDAAAAPGADAALAEALQRAGRVRRDVALLGRVAVAPGDPPGAAPLLAWAAEHRLDGLELVPGGGTGPALAVLRNLVPQLVDAGAPRPATLRAALGLRESVAVAS